MYWGYVIILSLFRRKVCIKILKVISLICALFIKECLKFISVDLLFLQKKVSAGMKPLGYLSIVTQVAPMFGLLGFDWGYGFDEVPGLKDAAGSRFHISINQSID